MRTVRRVGAHLLLLALLQVPPLGAQEVGPLEDEVVLRAGDLLRVEIWREEDLSGEFTVDREGIVTLPLLGRQEVEGAPWREVHDRLMEAYRAELRNPSISLTPLRRVYVLGEVNVPGIYEVDPTISVAGAVALAGGASERGDLDRVRVVREGALILERLPAESALVRAGIRSGDQIFVEKRSWWERNSTFLVSATISVASIVVAIVR